MTAGNGAIVAILQATPDPVVSQAAYRFYADGTEDRVAPRWLRRTPRPPPP